MQVAFCECFFALFKIFAKDIELFGPSYNGCVKVRFWINDEWIWIYIDDRLPTINGELCYSRCTNPTHFWIPLLEKAYAK